MTELQILNAVKTNGGSVAYTKLLNISLADANHSPAADKQLIRNLISADILSGSTGAYGTIRFGRQGELRLRQLQQDESTRAENIRAEQAQEQNRLDQIVADKADRNAERRADRIFQIFLAVLPLLLPDVIGILERFLNLLMMYILPFFH